jgi:heme/copper-type cytochrome/quinol oxidase subunit 2
MKLLKLVTTALIIIGLVIVMLGVIFLLQSRSSLGPSTSFMYSNPEWTVNGYIIIATGVIVIGLGVIKRQYSKKHS